MEIEKRFPEREKKKGAYARDPGRTGLSHEHAGVEGNGEASGEERSV